MSDDSTQVSESTFLRSLYELSASVIRITDLEDLLWHVAREVVGSMGLEDCVIYLLDEQRQVLVQQAAAGRKNPEADVIVNRLVIPVGEGVTGQVAATGRPLRLDDVGEAASYVRDIVAGKSELCVPILYEGRILGVIDSEDERPAFYTGQHQSFLESVASLLASKIEQIRLNEKLRRAERERNALLEIAAVNAEFGKPESYFPSLHRALTGIVPVDELMIGFFERSTNTLTIPFSSTAEGYEFGGDSTTPVEDLPPLVRELVRQDESTLLCCNDFEPLKNRGVLGHDAVLPLCCAFAPFTIDEQTSGFLVAQSYHETRPLDGEDLQFLTLVTAAICDAYREQRAERARRLAEKQLSENESRMRSIIENAPFSIVLKTEDNRILAAGSEVMRRTGLSQEQIAGRTDIPGMDPEDLLFYQRMDEEVARTGKVLRRELVRAGKDSDRQHILVTKFPVFDDDGGLLGIGGIGIDISEQRRAEEQLRQVQRLEVVGELTGGIAHDFNNLLMAILGGVEQATRYVDNDERLASILDLIRRAADRGADLTRRLSVFSRMQVFSNTPSNIDTAIENALPLLRQALHAGIHMEVEKDENLWFALSDENFLEQALLNLTINARDAMPDGGTIRIRAVNTQIDQADGAVEAGDYVRLSVSDTGIGMSEEIVARAFDPFFTTKEVGKGTGLGLSMVFGFVRQSGGHISIDSQPGAGTTVTLLLRRSLEEPAGQQEDDFEITAAWPKGVRVLVVEDDEGVIETLREHLSQMGLAAELAVDGTAAVELMKRRPKGFDLLISDFALPGDMHGRKVAERFLEANPDGRVLHISGYAEDAVVRNGRLDDGHSFLAKPFTRAMLGRKIAEVLDG